MDPSKLYLCKVVGYDQDGMPFEDGEVVLMLGTIEQMPGHVAVVKKDGRVLFGYHAERFCELPKEEA